MLSELIDFQTGWYGIQIGMTHQELVLFIERLSLLRDEKIPHFHLTSDYSQSGGIGDIEFYLKDPMDNLDNNMEIGF